MSAGAPDNRAGEKSSEGLSYAAAGVSIAEGDRFVDLIQPLMRRTFGPRVIENPGGFAGMFRLDYNEKLFKRNYKDPVLVACADGVGTKVKIATAMHRFDTVGIDLVAMNVNDLIVQGAEPLFFLDYIAVSSLDPEAQAELVKGVVEGCRQADAALLGGETAEMPDVYPPGEFDLAGFSVGVVELARATDSERIEPGDLVIGIASSGVHSNGFSLARRVVEHAELDLNRVYPELDEQQRLGDVLLTPTRIYARSIVKVQRGYRVKKVITGMAHITGGGLAGNLQRALHSQVDAMIDTGSWSPLPIFGFLQEKGGVSDEEMQRVFNMGVGYCLVVRPSFAASILDKLRRSGEDAFMLGEIVEGEGRVRLR